MADPASVRAAFAAIAAQAGRIDALVNNAGVLIEGRRVGMGADDFDRLIAQGFLYDSSLMVDDMPYAMATRAGESLELPLHWGGDDWPPFAHYDEIGYLMPVRAPSVGLQGFFEEFGARHQAGGFWIGVFHPFPTGRLARWRVLETWLEGVLARGDAWFAPLAEIAAHVARVRAEGCALRVERLPYYDRPVHLSR